MEYEGIVKFAVEYLGTKGKKVSGFRAVQKSGIIGANNLCAQDGTQYFIGFVIGKPSDVTITNNFETPASYIIQQTSFAVPILGTIATANTTIFYYIGYILDIL
jgi:hypothetical protein